METQPVVFLIGGPDTGKTNFLGRLWLCLRSRKGFLSAQQLPPDAKYINQVSQELLKGRYAGHTSRGDETKKSQILVQVTKDTTESRIVVLPDRSGEQWNSDFRKRQWPIEFEELLSEKAGCLLFVRAASERNVASLDPMKYAELVVFRQEGELASQASRTSTKQGNDEDDEDIDGDDFYNSIPTQVILVDWIQCIREAFDELCGCDFRPKIGIVVTAWDLTPADQQSLGLQEYIKKTFPMLWQFLLANDDTFEFQIFGSSVAGIDLDIDELREDYIKGDPLISGQIIHALTGSEETSSDFTLPLAWALGENVLSK